MAPRCSACAQRISRKISTVGFGLTYAPIRQHSGRVNAYWFCVSTRLDSPTAPSCSRSFVAFPSSRINLIAGNRSRESKWYQPFFIQGCSAIQNLVQASRTSQRRRFSTSLESMGTIGSQLQFKTLLGAGILIQLPPNLTASAFTGASRRRIPVYALRRVVTMRTIRSRGRRATTIFNSRDR